ncbi:valine--tRNA ligase [Granulicella sibirica]|uniref:Valine--tRNA ligase n=1 Tax=Granulicella sibirica TaxID=2479048 RepID=A0A4Q0T5L8_9BACT|nr:valine--tRNA ligase [Granulicella sibirica]RXH57920.1 Valyl-tRNA synthetase [Granulicella sibirica]
MSDEKSNAYELPKAYDPSTIEERWAEYWVRERLFDVASPSNTQEATKKFTMLLPPPNVTGRLHMGHMLNQAEMDILTRWHRMLGETALWVPGTDHAGIATQMMVERALASEGTKREALGREAFVKRVWCWKKEYGGAITGQMRRLGASVDWSREYFTMDDGLSVAVKEAFVRLYEQGLIYRGAYIVNWDPAIQTAVSDLEVEHEERVGKIYHVRYDLADGTGSITIATTRPETMLGDVAVAVNPSDERYTALVGKMLALPLVGREIPVVADEWANPEFGTGAVKVTPAHDVNDFAIGQRHNLPNLIILDKTAHIDLEGSPYHGMERYEAREQIVADLEALGALVEIKEHTNSIALSQRSGVVIEPRLSMQWFIAVNKTPSTGGDSIAEKAIAAVRDNHIRFTPEMYSKTYFEWMNNIHDWCISRQLWWGHRIPAWHCDKGHITVSRETPEACSMCGSSAITQETDVLDTWFSSGLLPFTVFGWPESTADLTAFYPTQLLVTGFDILFFWVARMIMLGSHFMLDVPMQDGTARKLADAVPFREVYIHALVRDADRQKMSKTKGNVIDPIDIINRFGTDAVRFTLASMASPGTDIAFSEARTEGYRAFANKIWNSARFLFMNVDRARDAGVAIDPKKLAAALQDDGSTSLETRWILARLGAATEAVDKALKDYRFDEAASAIYQFFWGDFCDWYIEIVKLRLNFGPEDDLASATAALTTLLAVFEAALRLLSPFMPFITEEIWHAFWPQIGLEVPAKSIALTRYPVPADFPADGSASVAAMTLLQEMIVAVRGLRKEMSVPEKEAAPIRVFGQNRVVALVDQNTDLLRRLSRVSEVEFTREAMSGNGTRSTSAFDVQVVYERTIDVPAERERLTKDLAKYEKGLQAAERQLGNEAFMAKAPAHIVEGLRKQATETKTQYDKTKAGLDALPPA